MALFCYRRPWWLFWVPHGHHAHDGEVMLHDVSLGEVWQNRGLVNHISVMVNHLMVASSAPAELSNLQGA